MTARAHIEHDPIRFGLRIAIRLDASESESHMLSWSEMDPIVRTVQHHEAAAETDYLRLPEDAARALYEALAEHYGHAANDVRLLRRDYEAERKRVDLFIAKAVQQ